MLNKLCGDVLVALDTCVAADMLEVKARAESIIQDIEESGTECAMFLRELALRVADRKNTSASEKAKIGRAMRVKMMDALDNGQGP